MRAGRSSISVVAGSGTDVLGVSRNVQRRFGPMSHPQIAARLPARRFASNFALTLSSVSRNRLVLRHMENNSRQDWIDAVRLANVALAIRFEPARQGLSAT
jgi:hypothetical protein